MCSPFWETHIPSDICFPTWERHIPGDMCSPTCIPKGLTHGLGPKMAFFQLFFLGNISQENIFYDILKQKKRPFWAIKTRS